jgi:glycerate-2-kinase
LIVKASLEHAFKTPIQVAQPAQTLFKQMLKPPKGRMVVIGADKSTQSRALAFETRPDRQNVLP